jgi:hypothetical protein
VADLRIEDAVLADAQATLRAAGDQLAPVTRTLPGLDAEVVGADPLAVRLREAQQLLGAEFGIVGQALTALSSHASAIGTGLTQADLELGRAAGGAR